MSLSIQLRGGNSGPVLTGGNTGDVVTKNADGSVSFQPGGGAGSVLSVFGRTGAVVAVAGDYDASQVANDSDVSGATVADALNTLLGGGGAVSSVFGRTGAVAAVAGDYSPGLVGGYVPVANTAARNALPNAIRAIGTTAFVADSGHMFRLEGGTANINWVDVTVQLVTAAASGVVPAFPAGKSVLSADGTSPAFTAYLALGATPATVGTIRLSPESSIQVDAFGAVDDMNVWSCSNNADNTQIFGDANRGGTVLQGQEGIILTIAGNQALSMNAASAYLFQPEFVMAGPSFTWRCADLAGGVAAPLFVHAQGTSNAADPGAPVVLAGGVPGAGGTAGGVRLGLNTDNTLANVTPLLEVRQVAAARRVVALALGAPVTATQMPANTGDLVTLIGNANVVPSAAPVGGFIFGATGGNLVIYTPNAAKTTVGAAGGAAALPALPSEYLPIKFRNVDYAIPLFAA